MMLDMLKEFLKDQTAWDMFVTGRAGTGKTTGLAIAVQHCIDNDIPYIVCAYTHKACDILREKLPANAEVRTLHSWLKKRPGVNTNATKLKHIDISTKTGDSTRPKIVFIDEYSMVGEDDLMDIRSMQDEDYDATPEVKVCWLGDPHQLPPVGDMQSVRPFGKYALTLTTIYRQADDNPLKDTLDLLVNFIENKEQPRALPAHATLERGVDIVEAFKYSLQQDKVLLAYTNKRVQELNCAVQGRAEPEPDDILFSPTTKQTYKFVRWLEPCDVTYVTKPFGDDLYLNSKYKTLEYLLASNICNFALVIDEDGEQRTFATAFGHYTYREVANRLKTLAANSNQAIERQYRGVKAALWAKANPHTPLARARAKAWRDFLGFDDCVICLDFAHAMTVHKSQGSTYKEVYLDSNDLSICSDFSLYLRLMYVAISRASTKVVTN